MSFPIITKTYQLRQQNANEKSLHDKEKDKSIVKDINNLSRLKK